ncbi:hypothetical protein [Azospirillum sp.]|nr:hypothetical protein [Azospirillum sp.]
MSRPSAPPGADRASLYDDITGTIIAQLRGGCVHGASSQTDV